MFSIDCQKLFHRWDCDENLSLGCQNYIKKSLKRDFLTWFMCFDSNIHPRSRGNLPR